MPLDVPTRESGWRARLALAFERRAARTVLARREHEGPLVVQKALHPEGDAVCHAIVVHPPAGLVGGDELRLSATVGAGAHALLTTPGATKWYRSAGARASQDVRLDLGEGSRIEWLPQENILYDGVRAEARWRVDLAAGARLFAWDIFCLGRTASGESFTHGEVRVQASVRREGRLAWMERAVLQPGRAAMNASAGLAGAPVFGTLVVAAPQIEAAWLAAARAAAPREGEAAATRLPGILLVRYLGASTEAARQHFTAVWERLREPVLGVAAVQPRIWRT